MADVFISYKKEDRDLAERVANALAAYEVEVWWDKDLVGGHVFRSAISEELRKAKVVIVIWSGRSVKSDWVLDEADYAKGYGKLLPIRFALDFDVPLGFRQVQVESLEGWAGAPDDPRFKRLVAQIEQLSERKFSVIAQALGPNLRAGAESTARMGGAFFKSLASADFLGLPLSRFLGRGLIASALLAAAIAFWAHPPNTELSLMTRLIDGAIVAVPFFFIVRALHQYVMFKKGASSRRVFDPPFRFWIWLASLLAVMWATLSVDVLDPMNIVRALPINFVVILGAIVLLRTLLSMFSGTAADRSEPQQQASSSN